MLASGTLAIGRDGRVIASAVLSPPLARLAWPISPFLRQLTIESLPPVVANLYGLRQTPGSADRAFARLRRLRRALPGVVAEWRGARRAAAALTAETRRTA
jgi:hypothetical protein